MLLIEIPNGTSAHERSTRSISNRCGVEQWLARQSHKLKVERSNRSTATTHRADRDGEVSKLDTVNCPRRT